MADIITLIKQTVTYDDYGREEISESSTTVLCEVESIQQSEFFAAADTELNPEYRFTVFFGEYDGENIVEYNNERFAIYRTYRTGDDLELYVERKIGA